MERFEGSINNQRRHARGNLSNMSIILQSIITFGCWMSKSSHQELRGFYTYCYIVYKPKCKQLSHNNKNRDMFMFYIVR